MSFRILLIFYSFFILSILLVFLLHLGQYGFDNYSPPNWGFQSPFNWESKNIEEQLGFWVLRVHPNSPIIFFNHVHCLIDWKRKGTPTSKLGFQSPLHSKPEYTLGFMFRGYIQTHLEHSSFTSSAQLIKIKHHLWPT